jgi:hypothetical protein
MLNRLCEKREREDEMKTELDAGKFEILPNGAYSCVKT